MRKPTILFFVALALPLMLCAEFETMWQHQAQTEFDSNFKAVTLLSQERIVCVGGSCTSGSAFPSGYLSMFDLSGNSLNSVVAERDGWSELAAVVPATNSDDFFTIGTSFAESKGMQTWIAKWDDELNLIWEGFFGGDGEDFGYSLVALDDGACLALSSVTDGLEGFHDVEMLKLSSEGDSLWAVRYGYATNDEGREIIDGGDGTYYIAGASSQYDSTRNSEIWVLHVDSDGNVLHESATSILGSGSVDYDSGFGVVRHDSGMITAVGITAAEGQERMDAGLVRLDGDLDAINSENYEIQGFYDFAYDVIAPDASDDAILCGCTRDFDNQRNCGYLLRADSNLNELWRIYVTGDYATGLLDMCRIDDNEFICVGYADTEAGTQQPLVMRIRDRFVIGDFEIGPKTGHAPLMVDLESLCRTSPAYETIQWDVNQDGVWDDTANEFQFTYDTPGTYSIDVHLSGNGIDTTFTAVETIYVFDGDSSVLFPGTGSRVNIEADDNLSLTSAFTFEAWINPYSWNNTNAMADIIFCKGSNIIAIDHALRITLRTEDGTMCIGTTEPETIVLNSWQNIAISYSSANGAIALIDGVLCDITWDNEPTGNLQNNSTQGMTLGAHTAGFNMYHGVMDEARLWNIARTAVEIQETMEEPLQGFEDGLIGYWQMNEANGSTLNDSGLFNHHGELIGTDWRQGCNFIPHDNDNETIPAKHTTGIVTIFPNPFNPSTTVSFSIDQPSLVELDIYNIKGQKVKSLLHERKNTGLHQVLWNGNDRFGIPCASGIYLVRLKAGNMIHAQRILMLK